MEKHFIEEAKKKLLDIAEVCYEGNIETGIAGMNYVISDIQKITMEIKDEKLQNRMLNDALIPMLEAMESKDSTALGDRITYELVPLLEELM